MTTNMLKCKVDPERVKEGDIKENIEKLKNTCQMFFDTIVGSVDRIPL
jgi:hypothetical protein